MTDAATVHGWMMTGQGQPFEEGTFELGPVPPGEALIEVAGCGVCHTDVSFLHHGVQTRAELPLVLGHEVSGTVVGVGEGVIGVVKKACISVSHQRIINIDPERINI